MKTVIELGIHMKERDFQGNEMEALGWIERESLKMQHSHDTARFVRSVIQNRVMYGRGDTEKRRKHD